MKLRLFAFVLVGCASDPPVDAWHHSYELDTFARADGACDAPLEVMDPVAPYLFVAVQRLPDTASLYWCNAPEDCPAPFGTVLLTRLDEQHLEGEVAVADVSFGLCTARWMDVVAEQRGAEMSLLFRAGISEHPGLDEQGCLDAVESEKGDACETVLSLAGTRIE